MYLNHFFLLEPVAAFTVRYLPSGILTPALQQVLGTLLLTAASAALAGVTFCVVEWPFLRWRERLLSHGRQTDAAPVSEPAAGRLYARESQPVPDSLLEGADFKAPPVIIQ